NKIVEMPELSELHTHASVKAAVPASDGKFLAFCGIGNPSNFYRQLSSEGLDVVVKKPYPDHHYYRRTEIKKLENLARSGGANAMLTTGKDAVKLVGIEFTMPCFVVKTELTIDRADDFRRLIIPS
ncbi:MAG: tetraacyldisaccharide 4'-kinase, partial [Pyrinomonadaceae bacterium]